MTLFIVPTPIGNLKDITFRAIEVLRSVDFILCEDTRQTAKLLHHYQISTPLHSFHAHNEVNKEKRVIDLLLEGQSAALVSDAGTPLISDPGGQLVQTCRAQGLSIVALPGPNAAITALTASGLPCDRFQFLGFLPRKATPLKQSLSDALAYSGTTILYEAPHRLLDLLGAINELSPNRTLVVARELTKCFEEVISGSAEFLIAHYRSHPLKGEIVLLIKGCTKEEAPPSLEILQKEVLDYQQKKNTTLSEAIKAIAELHGISKKELYRILHK